MKTIVSNKNDLKEEEVTEVVKRVKALLINSKIEILLGYSHNEYQFPGGHVEEQEELNTAIIREIKEEVGIDLNIKSLTPFACLLRYVKDLPEKGKNRKIEIYYYEIKTDEKPNLKKTSYTLAEQDGNFELRYIPLTDFKKELLENSKKYGDKKGISKEMIELYDVYTSSLYI